MSAPAADGLDIYGGFPDDIRGLFALVGDTPPPENPLVERPRVDEQPRGRSGRAHFSGFIQVDEPNRKWIGPEGLRLADQMWRTDGDIKRATLAVWSPLQSATWAWEPFGGDRAGKKDKEAAELVEWNLNEYMAPNFVEHLGELGPILLRSGYTDFEQIWKSTSQGGKKRVGVKKLDLRLPRTIWKFYQDADGDLTGIVQFLPNSKNVWIPANDILHYRIQAEGDNWTGTSLYRHAYKHFYYKEKLEALDAIGQERKAVGVPIIYPPEGAAEQTKEEVEAIFANLHTNEAGFVIMPGPKRQGTDPSNIGWEVEIVTFDSSSSSGIKDSIDQQTTKIAGAFMTDFLELGHHQVGARATAEVQEDPFLTSVNALGTLIKNPIQRLGARIAAMNFDGLEGAPKLKLVMHDEASLSEIATYVRELVVAEAIAPDNDLEDWLREHGNLPMVNKDARKQREEDRQKAREQQEQGVTTEVTATGAPAKKPGTGPGAGKENQLKNPSAEPKLLDNPIPPPHLREATDLVHRCGRCKMFNHGRCWGYNNLSVERDWVCDSFDPSEASQGTVSNVVQLDAPSPAWYENLLSQNKLSQALDGARESMEFAVRASALKLATAASNRARSGRQIRMTAPDDLRKDIAAEFERLYALGYRTVAEELKRQHEITETKPVLTLDAADGDPTPEEEEQEQEEIKVTPGKRKRRVSRRASIAAEHITGETTREAERQALNSQNPLEKQRAVEARAIAALHKEAMSNSSSVINEGRRDAALAAGAMFAAKRAVYGPSGGGEGAGSIGGPEISLRGIYTAVLDGRTCDNCALADDGVEREPDDPALEVPNPMCSGSDYCRCTVVWVLAVAGQEGALQPALSG